MNIDRLDDTHAKRLRPRDWRRLARDLEPPRPPGRRDRLGDAHRRERDRRRPELVAVACDACGEPLAEVRAGTSCWCRGCRLWSGGSVARHGG